eukprot:scaffold490482_cov38-Prasinocladus_malaysianus.AAC.2
MSRAKVLNSPGMCMEDCKRSYGTVRVRSRGPLVQPFTARVGELAAHFQLRFGKETWPCCSGLLPRPDSRLKIELRAAVKVSFRFTPRVTRRFCRTFH